MTTFFLYDHIFLAAFHLCFQFYTSFCTYILYGHSKKLNCLEISFLILFKMKVYFNCFPRYIKILKKNLTVSHIWFTFLHRRMRSSLLSFTSLQKTRISFSTIFHLLIISLLHNRFFSIMYLKSNIFLSLMAKIF